MNAGNADIIGSHNLCPHLLSDSPCFLCHADIRRSGCQNGNLSPGRGRHGAVGENQNISCLAKLCGNACGKSGTDRFGLIAGNSGCNTASGSADKVVHNLHQRLSVLSFGKHNLRHTAPGSPLQIQICHVSYLRDCRLCKQSFGFGNTHRAVLHGLENADFIHTYSFKASSSALVFSLLWSLSAHGSSRIEEEAFAISKNAFASAVFPIFSRS